MNPSISPVYLQYRLALHAPAIVSALAGDPNSAVSEHFIPGSSIRGALAARLQAEGVKTDCEEFLELVLSGSVRYLHAYPEISGARAMPVLASWRAQKDDPDNAYDLCQYSGDVSGNDSEDLDEVWPQAALAAPSHSFASAVAYSGARKIASPRLNGRIHHQRDRVKGRPWKDEKEQAHGAIFAYEYLEADQFFRGVIQVMSGGKVQICRIKQVLAAPIIIGRSRRSGYGGDATVSFVSETSREFENADGLLSRDLQPGERFRVVLTSPYIGRDAATGQIDPVALEQELSKALSATVERRRWTFEVVGGFNRKWRTEVPQQLALSAGSCIVLRATDKIDIASMRSIEHEGLGERRVEGFGRILFLKHTDSREPFLLEVSNKLASTESAASGRAPTDAAAGGQLGFIESRMVLAAARSEIARIASLDLANNLDQNNTPSTALVGRIRLLFRGVLDEHTAASALAMLATWCTADERDPNALKERARNQLKKSTFTRGSLRDSSLLDWLRKLGQPEHGKTRWHALVDACGKADALTGLASRNFVSTPEKAQRILEAHAGELSILLLDDVLAAIARMNRMRTQ